MQENVTVSEKEYFDDMFISDGYKTIETKMQYKGHTDEKCRLSSYDYRHGKERA